MIRLLALPRGGVSISATSERAVQDYQPRVRPARPATTPSLVPVPTPPSITIALVGPKFPLESTPAAVTPTAFVPSKLPQPPAHREVLARQQDRLSQGERDGNAIGEVFIAATQCIYLRLQRSKSCLDLAVEIGEIGGRSQTERGCAAPCEISRGVCCHEVQRCDWACLRCPAPVGIHPCHRVGISPGCVAEHLLTIARRRRPRTECCRVGERGAGVGADGGVGAAASRTRAVANGDIPAVCAAGVCVGAKCAVGTSLTAGVGADTTTGIEVAADSGIAAEAASGIGSGTRSRYSRCPTLMQRHYCRLRCCGCPSRWSRRLRPRPYCWRDRRWHRSWRRMRR